MRKYSLRICLSPSLDYEKRIDNVVAFCKDADIDDVMFFIAGEELCVGHITKEQAKKYVDVILKAKEVLGKEGITVSLNPWMTIGHWNAGRQLQEGQNFRTMVGHDGEKSTIVACPLCENWREYFIDLMNYYVETIKPKTLWLEDDFRLSNHEPVSLGCFCDEHVKLFNQKAGTNFDREGIINAIFSDKKYRQIYLDLARISFEDTLEEIASKINQDNFGLMTGGACLAEGKRFSKLFNILEENSKTKPYNRICLYSYRQRGLQEYAWSFNSGSMFVRFLTGDSAICLSEMENFPFSLYTKSAHYTKYQLLTTAPLRLEGDTINIFGMNGNAVNNYQRYAKVFKDAKPYLSKVTDLKLGDMKTTGIQVLVNENSAYTIKNAKAFRDLNPKETWIFAYLTQLGFNCAYTLNIEMQGQVVACSGEILRNYTNQEIIDLFDNNQVIINGKCMEVLKERNLLDLIGVEDYSVLKERNGTHTIEEWAGDDNLFGLEKFRATFQYFCGDYYDVKYKENSTKTVYTNVLNQYEKVVGVGIAKVGNTIILPYENIVSELNVPISLICPLRAEAIKRALVGRQENAELMFVEGENVCVYTFKNNDCVYAVLVNFADDDFEDIRLTTNSDIKEVQILTPNSPEFKSVAFNKDKNQYIISHELKGQESVVLRLK